MKVDSENSHGVLHKSGDFTVPGRMRGIGGRKKGGRKKGEEENFIEVIFVNL